MKCIVFFTILVFTLAHGTKKNSRMDMSKCSANACPPIEKPLCVKIKHKTNQKAGSFYVMVLNPCELKLLKCHQDVDGVIVPMKYCDHKAKAKTVRPLPNIKRYKRSVSNAPGEKLDQELDISPVKNTTTTQKKAVNATDTNDIRRGNAKRPAAKKTVSKKVAQKAPAKKAPAKKAPVKKLNTKVSNTKAKPAKKLAASKKAPAKNVVPAKTTKKVATTKPAKKLAAKATTKKATPKPTVTTKRTVATVKVTTETKSSSKTIPKWAMKHIDSNKSWRIKKLGRTSDQKNQTIQKNGQRVLRQGALVGVHTSGENFVFTKERMLRGRKEKWPRWRSASLARKKLKLRHKDRTDPEDDLGADEDKEAKEEGPVAISDAEQGQEGGNTKGLISPGAGEEGENTKGLISPGAGEEGENTKGLISPGAGEEGENTQGLLSPDRSEEDAFHAGLINPDDDEENKEDGDGLVEPASGNDGDAVDDKNELISPEPGNEGQNAEVSLESRSLVNQGAGGEDRLINEPMFSNLKDEEMVDPGGNRGKKLQGGKSEQDGGSEDRDKRENEPDADEEQVDPDPGNDGDEVHGEKEDGEQIEEEKNTEKSLIGEPLIVNPNDGAEEKQEFSEPEFKSPQEDPADQNGLTNKKLQPIKGIVKPTKHGDSGVSLEAPPDYDSKAISEEAKREEDAVKADPVDEQDDPIPEDKSPEASTDPPLEPQRPNPPTEISDEYQPPPPPPPRPPPNDDQDGVPDLEMSPEEHAANYPEYDSECPSVCPSRAVMACGRCNHGVYRTFVSVCHLRMFACKHSDEDMVLISRLPCVLSAPYIDPQLNTKPKGKLSHPDDDDKILRFIHCRERQAQAHFNGAVKTLKGISDLKCKFDSVKEPQRKEVPIYSQS